MKKMENIYPICPLLASQEWQNTMYKFLPDTLVWTLESRAWADVQKDPKYMWKVELICYSLTLIRLFWENV